MKLITEKEYKRMTPEEQKQHDIEVRNELIKQGLVRPQDTKEI